MKKFLFKITFFVFLFSCSQSSKYYGPVVAPSSVLKDMMSWLYYQRDYMIWSTDYIALDTSLNIITKNEFLQRLTTGRYFPLKIITRDSSLCYQLYKIDDMVNKEIIAVIKEKAITEYQYFKMEGKVLPNFNFVDLEGNRYNFETIRGRTIVLNCWFIRCKPCVAEMPKLNELVDKFKDKNDIIFVGLAFDAAKDLRPFLRRIAFNYKVVPDMEAYLMNDLKIISYPTHLVVNSKGVILKVINNNFNELVDFLDRQTELRKRL